MNTAHFLDFLYQSPTPQHAVSELTKLLLTHEFIELQENEPWALERNKSYVVSRGQSALIAFTVPTTFDGYHLIGAHTDSPVLKIRHVPEQYSKNYVQHAVEIYGGVLLHTWLDRDLCIAGVVFYEEKGELLSKLVNINDAFFKIPSLAIHLNRDVNDEGLKLNKHTHFNTVSGLMDLEHGTTEILKQRIATELKIEPTSIKGYDFTLYDKQVPDTIGLNNEFISSPRLDNLAMSFAGIDALLTIESVGNKLPMIALFDHEEVGSESYPGAAGTFLDDTLKRISSKLNLSTEDQLCHRANSVFISADMAHALHPNFKEKHDEYDYPLINKGPVIKYNTNERYATSAETESYIIQLCEKHKIPYQKFTNRQDLACGSTIGPATATRLGIKTVDIGNPMLSMHSIRELCGVEDMKDVKKLFIAFLENKY